MSQHGTNRPPRCPICQKALPVITRDYPLPGSAREPYRLDVYPAGTLYDHEVPILGHLNTLQAAAVWGVTVKTFYAAAPELRALGIISEVARTIRVDTHKFITEWIHANPDRLSRAEILRERDERRQSGERLRPGRPRKKPKTGERKGYTEENE